MSFDIHCWTRIEYEGTPVYVQKETSAWFVPNKAGDGILRHMEKNRGLNGDLSVHRFIERLPDTTPLPYPGRASLLKLDHLKELWFHVTNRCNLKCNHCLFVSSPDDKAGLSANQVLRLAEEGHALGCRVFVLTGGEPFIHQGFQRMVDAILGHDATHVVVLTNGMQLASALERGRWPLDRFHLQISVDGLQERHDRIRGKGTFERLVKNLKWLHSKHIPYTISMCVNTSNVGDMPDIVDFAADVGAGNVHFMWYFIRGRGQAEQFALPEEIFKGLTRASQRAKERGVEIDNIEALKTQVFAPSGTIHDGTTTAWESLAVGPDGSVYPSAALVNISELATDLGNGLETAWRESPVLSQIRQATAAGLSSPLRFLLGGGDTDHSYVHGHAFMGKDPYTPLYEKMALWLIAEEACRQKEIQVPQLRLKMGDVLESCGAHGRVALVHSNCLLATAQENSLAVVKSFYTEAAGDKKEEILNPVCYPEELISHIPERFRFRGYGCGSPVIDADIRKGEQVVDLGCGSGVECFVAARLTGPTGKVIGVDMLDPMLHLAKEGLKGVSKNLAFKNTAFKKGYLEKLPLQDASVDVILSNCVMNLSVNKRLSYSEILRVLRPGGRLVISDVVCDSEPDPAIRNDEVLRGECIAGAMTQKDLIGILVESGFQSIRLIKRFPYREVRGHPFFSLTYLARKPLFSEKVMVMYRGPLPNIVSTEGMVLTPGIAYHLPKAEAELLGEEVFILDENGAVTNVAAENTCACFQAPEVKTTPFVLADPGEVLQPLSSAKMASGCMVCGAPITYLSEPKEIACAYCQKTFSANALCEKGHFVCDTCHLKDGLKAIEHLCLQTEETDMFALLEEIRRHPAIPVHGPEHHALVPGIILATFRNLGGDIPPSVITEGIKRGSTIAGGHCAFMGVCGAAVGVGISFSLILDANPLKPSERKTVQTVTHSVLAEIAKLKAARCCQRDSWIALKKAAELSQSVLPIALQANSPVVCRQRKDNKECLGSDCPLLKANKKSRSKERTAKR
ncbi:MAG: DUF5714 domain-containing protein [Thermodesulfobacteriota bacterium]|nr:DUF5714 domain-containing protein [Thermodesulfobacteriota bacterium]